jgi:serine protease Do
MLIVVKRSLLGLGLAAFALSAPPAAAQPPQRASNSPWLPGLPGPSPDAPPADAAPAPPVGPAPVGLTPTQLYERVRRGVVALEKNGVAVAMGTVLAGDGRVLTALSGLAGADGADVRYADGTMVHAKVGRSDKGVDLALLVPQSIAWTDGLSASEAEPSESAELRAMLPARGFRSVGPTGAGVHGPVDAHSREGDALLRMLDVDVKGPPVAGAPLLDLTGRVVAVLVRACKGPVPQMSRQGAGAEQACMPVVVGAPVSTIRTFLTQNAPAPWLGIRGETDASGNVHGVRVTAVAPSSPAEQAILKPEDVIVAVDGQPIENPETLSDVIARHTTGDTVHLLVFAEDRFRDVLVSLRKAPDPERVQ